MEAARVTARFNDPAETFSQRLGLGDVGHMMHTQCAEKTSTFVICVIETAHLWPEESRRYGAGTGHIPEPREGFGLVGTLCRWTPSGQRTSEGRERRMESYEV